MNIELGLGMLGIGILVALARTRDRGKLLGLPGLLMGVWSLDLILLGICRPMLDFSTTSLVGALLPLIIGLLVCSGRWFRERPSCDIESPGRLTVLALITIVTATSLLLVYDVFKLNSYAQQKGLVYALSQARADRFQGHYYPTILSMLNPLRMLAAPLGLMTMFAARGRGLKTVSALGVVVGVGGTIVTTGRAAFVITVLWLWGCAYFVRMSRWGMRGLLQRLGATALAGAVFFVVYGLAIGKIHPSPMIDLPDWIRRSPLFSAATTLIVYVTGPLAALPTSLGSALGPEFAGSTIYPVLKLLKLMGIPVGQLYYALPTVGIPFPMNLYTFLGPGYWVGGVAGAVLYVAVVLSLLIYLDNNVGRFNTIYGGLLYGYWIAATVMSLSSDYFFTKGFSYLVYAFVFLHVVRKKYA